LYTKEISPVRRGRNREGDRLKEDGLRPISQEQEEKDFTVKRNRSLL
jgi:hypothetical protein